MFKLLFHHLEVMRQARVQIVWLSFICFCTFSSSVVYFLRWSNQNGTHHPNCSCFIDLYKGIKMLAVLFPDSFIIIPGMEFVFFTATDCWCFHWAIQPNLKISFLFSSPAVDVSTLGSRESIHDPSILYPDGNYNKDECDLVLLGKTDKADLCN